MTDNEALQALVIYAERQTYYLAIIAVCCALHVGYLMFKTILEALTRPRIFG